MANRDATPNMKPTEKQITKEIEVLKKLKPRVRRRTAFGDDNHAAIDTQLAVLEGRMDTDAIYDCEDYNEHQRDAALEARRWLDGEEESSLVAGWKELAEA